VAPTPASLERAALADGSIEGTGTGAAAIEGNIRLAIGGKSSTRRHLS
jgi:hypothetical protein